MLHGMEEERKFPELILTPGSGLNTTPTLREGDGKRGSCPSTFGPPTETRGERSNTGEGSAGSQEALVLVPVMSAIS